MVEVLHGPSLWNARSHCVPGEGHGRLANESVAIVNKEEILATQRQCQGCRVVLLGIGEISCHSPLLHFVILDMRGI